MVVTVWLDGPMGTELGARGVALPDREWSAQALDSAPEVVSAIHRAHAALGVDVLRTNTFRTTRRMSGDRWRERLATAVRLAREAAQGQRIAGVIAPLEDCYRPELSPPPEVARQEHAELAAALREERVDLILCETFPHPIEARIATEAAVATGLETWVALTAGPGGELMTPAAMAEAARSCVAGGAKAVLVNCVAAAITGPYVEALSALGVPCGAYANQSAWGKLECGPAEYFARTQSWLQSGASMLGACCGTSLAHLRAAGDALGRHRLWLAEPMKDAPVEALSPTERAAHERFRFERDRDLYATAHLLLRRALTAATGTPERDWDFEEDANGRPRLVPGLTGPSFNLTHTHGLAAVVTGPTTELGVDAEQVGQRGDLLPVAEHWFNSEEVAGLRMLPDEERQRRFLCFWTVKEAYLKARGVGLRLPLHQLTVRLGQEPAAGEQVTPELVLGPELLDDPRGWTFRLLAHGEKHLVAIAAKTKRFELKLT